jgi:hypothetical protein
LAWLIALLQAIMRLQRRELRSLFSVALNNFFLFVAVLLIGGLSSLQMGGTHPLAGIAPFFLVLGLILIFPLSTNPLSRVPASRLGSWPLDRDQTLVLRLASLTINPILWITIILLALKVGTESVFLFFLIALAVQGISIFSSYLFARLPSTSSTRHMPHLPSGVAGIAGLALRQIIITLDFYLALLLSVSGCAYRWISPRPNPDAFPILGMLVALALSTYAQQGFGVDSASAISRYRLLPLRGWQIVLAKDLGYLVILVLLVLPLNLGAGLTFGLIALSIGRYPSLRLVFTQQRWRFTSGNIWFGAFQIVAGFALGISTARTSLWFFLGAALLYGASIPLGGWLWDRNGACS